jgi:hypothetical protein
MAAFVAAKMMYVRQVIVWNAMGPMKTTLSVAEIRQP